MNLLDLVTGAWAIQPENLIELQAVYATHMRGEKIDIAAIEARLGRPLASEQQIYEVFPGGVAVLRMSGILSPKANLLMQVSGGVSTQMMTKQLESAAADPRVSAIVLSMDTPGGSVIGVPESAAAVKALSAIKPIVVHSDGVLASAGYWIGSAANAIYLSGSTAMAGSIGIVINRTFDPSAATKEEHIIAGRYKCISVANEPLSKEARAIHQADVDYVYSLFIDDVAAYRGTTAQLVLDNMADGRVFRGQQAIDAGLVDGMITLDALVEQVAANPAQFSTRRKSVFAGKPNSKPAGVQALTTPVAQAAVTKTEPVSLTPVINSKGSTMDMKDLKEQHPALFAQIEAENAAAVAAASVTAASAERDRIIGVRATALPGHEALVEKLAFDGKTTPAEAALAVNAAHRASITAAAAAHDADAPKALPHAAAPSDKAKSRAEMTAEASAYAKEHGVGILDAVKALGFAV
jgi:capsid assembly protease